MDELQTIPDEQSYTRGSSERVEARFDLVFAAGREGSKRFVELRGMEPNSMSFTRNPATIADEWSVSLPYEYLPFDLGVLQDSNATAIMWIAPEGSGPLDNRHPGVFTGILDKISRTDQGDIQLNGRDLSGLLMDAQLTGDQLDDVIQVIRVRKTLKSAVLAIIDEAFAGVNPLVFDPKQFTANQSSSSQWRVKDTTKGRLTDANVVKTLGVKNRTRLRPPTLRERMGAVQGGQALGGLAQVFTNMVYGAEYAGFFDKAAVLQSEEHPDDFDARMRTSPEQTQTAVNPTTKTDQLIRRRLESHNRLLIDAELPKNLVVDDSEPYKLLASHIWPGGRSTSAWDAIYRICVLMGAIPEVIGLDDENGEPRPTIVLLDVEALQTSNPLRGFKRMEGNKEVGWRKLSRNLSIFDLKEDLDISPDVDRPSYVNMVSTLPSGKRIFASFGAKDSKLVGSLQTIVGVNSEESLQRIAKSVWLDMRKSRAIYSGTIQQTYTDGGSPSGADVLDIRYGSAVQLDFGFEVDSSETLEKYLEKMQIPRSEVDAIAASLRSGARLPIMQVQDLTVQYDQGAFTADITMRRLINPEQYVTAKPSVDEPFEDPK